MRGQSLQRAAKVGLRLKPFTTLQKGKLGK